MSALAGGDFVLGRGGGRLKDFPDGFMVAFGANGELSIRMEGGTPTGKFQA